MDKLIFRILTNFANPLGTFLSLRVHHTVKYFAESGLAYEIETRSKWKPFRRKQNQKTPVFAIYFIFDHFISKFSINMPKGS